MECGSALWMDWKDLYEIADKQLDNYDSDITKMILVTINNWLTYKTILANCPHLNYSTPPVEVSLDFQTEYENEIKRLKEKHYIYDSTDDDLETYTTLILIRKKETDYLYYLYPLELEKWYKITRTLKEKSLSLFVPLTLKQKNHTKLIDIGYLPYNDVFIKTYTTNLDGIVRYHRYPKKLDQTTTLSIPNTKLDQILRPGVLSSLASSRQFLNYAYKLIPDYHNNDEDYNNNDHDDNDDDDDIVRSFFNEPREFDEQEWFTRKLASSIGMLQDVPRDDEDELEEYRRGPQDPRRYAALACDGELYYVVGGENSRGDLLRSAWSFDPSTKTWKSLANLPKPRSRASAYCLDGKMYIFGGVTNESARMERCEAQSEICVPKIDEWFPGPMLRYPKAETKVLISRRELYLVGGMGFHSSFNSDQTVPTIESDRHIEIVNSLNGSTRSIKMEASHNATLMDGIFVNLTREFVQTQLKNVLDKTSLIN